jgi:NADPH-dependent curcumin reductase CurA
MATARELGYDEVIDYTGKDTRALIKELRAATGGGGAVNGYFDNAGMVATTTLASLCPAS